MSDWFIAIAIAFGGWGLAGSANSLVAKIITAGVFGTALPMWIIHWRLQSTKTHAASQQEARDMAGAGSDSSKLIEHFEQDSGIVLNPAQRTVTMLLEASSAKKKVCKTYGFDQVRDWQISKVVADQVALSGRANVGEAMVANVSASAAANRQTGLFLNVKDTEHPKWRIAMRNVKDQERWNEILRQEILEGEPSGMPA